jgi:hypothetical protein
VDAPKIFPGDAAQRPGEFDGAGRCSPRQVEQMASVSVVPEFPAQSLERIENSSVMP